MGGRLRHDVALGPLAAAVGVGGADVVGRFRARDRGRRADGAAVGRFAGRGAGLAGVGAGSAGVALGRGGFDRRRGGRCGHRSGSGWTGHWRRRRRRRSRDRRRRGRRVLGLLASAAAALEMALVRMLIRRRLVQKIGGLQIVEILVWGVDVGHFHGHTGRSRMDEA